MTADDLFHFLPRGIGAGPEKSVERHQDARGTEPALQSMMPAKCRLQHGQAAVRRCQAFDSAHIPALRLHG
jgi:hypothetical protein